jgi:hypothetical protein
LEWAKKVSAVMAALGEICIGARITRSAAMWLLEATDHGFDGVDTIEAEGKAVDIHKDAHTIVQIFSFSPY